MAVNKELQKDILMSNAFDKALNTWLTLKHQSNWVLGIVLQTKGSVYRKSGAMMLLSEAGHQLGILSGGCLESDLKLQARKALALGKAMRVIYDSEDVGGLAWRLGIGCGGSAEILLLPCNEANQYLQLEALEKNLSNSKACEYTLDIEAQSASLKISNRDFTQKVRGTCLYNQANEIIGIRTHINPPPQLLILGGGADMQPVAEMATTLNWRVNVSDPRPANARADQFGEKVELHDYSPEELPDELLQNSDCVIIANHNITLDAKAIKRIAKIELRYIGLLGPTKRKNDVLKEAGLRESDLKCIVKGPLGLALGGDLPESIALSALAECHAKLFGSTANAMSTLTD
ncbi:MAG: xanthine dehydrogenase accessory factor [Flavobacteriales bacterium]